MKKFLSLAVLALVGSVVAVNAETLTVCDGTNTNFSLPLKNTYYDTQGSHSQMIYPAADLAAMNGQQINSMMFYASDVLNMDGGSVVVSLGESESATYASATYIDNLTQVASMSLTSGETEITVTFDSPYTYNGGNLVVDFVVAEAGTVGYAWKSFFGVNQESGHHTAITREGTLETFLPQVTFDYGTPQEWAAAVNPTEVTFNTIRAEKTDVQTIVLKNNGLNAFTPAFGALAAPFSTTAVAAELAPGAQMEIPITFAPTAEGEYTGTFTINCGEAGNLEVALAGTALEAANELVVCDAATTTTYVPVYGLYYDTQNTTGQMIYPADMLTDLVGTKITSLTFYPAAGATMFYNGTLELGLQVVDADSFAEKTPLTGFTTVASVSPAQGDTELTFTFTEPFEYNGGNLAIQTLVTTAGTFKSTAFYAASTENNASLYSYTGWSSTTTEFDKHLPKATFLYQKEETPVAEPKIVFNPESGAEVMAGTVVTVTAEDVNYDDYIIKVSYLNNEIEGNMNSPVNVTLTESGFVMATVWVYNENLEDYVQTNIMGSATYIVLPTPVISITPDGGTFNNSQEVTVNVENMPEDASIYYEFEDADGVSDGEMLLSGNTYTVTKSGYLTIRVVRESNDEAAPALKAVTTGVLAEKKSQFYTINTTPTGIDTLTVGKNVKSISYFNTTGQQSSAAFKGVNIVVVEYQDGSNAVAKIVK